MNINDSRNDTTLNRTSDTSVSHSMHVDQNATYSSSKRPHDSFLSLEPRNKRFLITCSKWGNLDSGLVRRIHEFIGYNFALLKISNHFNLHCVIKNVSFRPIDPFDPILLAWLQRNEKLITPDHLEELISCKQAMEPGDPDLLPILYKVNQLTLRTTQRLMIDLFPPKKKLSAFSRKAFLERSYYVINSLSISGEVITRPMIEKMCALFSTIQESLCEDFYESFQLFICHNRCNPFSEELNELYELYLSYPTPEAFVRLYIDGYDKNDLQDLLLFAPLFSDDEKAQAFLELSRFVFDLGSERFELKGKRISSHDFLFGTLNLHESEHRLRICQFLRQLIEEISDMNKRIIALKNAVYYLYHLERKSTQEKENILNLLRDINDVGFMPHIFSITSVEHRDIRMLIEMAQEISIYDESRDFKSLVHLLLGLPSDEREFIIVQAKALCPVDERCDPWQNFLRIARALTRIPARERKYLVDKSRLLIEQLMQSSLRGNRSNKQPLRPENILLAVSEIFYLEPAELNTDFSLFIELWNECYNDSPENLLKAIVSIPHEKRVQAIAHAKMVYNPNKLHELIPILRVASQLNSEAWQALASEADLLINKIVFNLEVSKKPNEQSTGGFFKLEGVSSLVLCGPLLENMQTLSPKNKAYLDTLFEDHGFLRQPILPKDLVNLIGLLPIFGEEMLNVLQNRLSNDMCALPLLTPSFLHFLSQLKTETEKITYLEMTDRFSLDEIPLIMQIHDHFFTETKRRLTDILFNWKRLVNTDPKGLQIVYKSVLLIKPTQRLAVLEMLNDHLQQYSKKFQCEELSNYLCGLVLLHECEELHQRFCEHIACLSLRQQRCFLPSCCPCLRL